MRRRVKQAELQPVYVRPVFERREREARAAFRAVAYSADRIRKAAVPGVDPLWMRLGLRACMVDNRAGWVVSNPFYDETLRRVPSIDPSLPGPGWLREVYRSNRDLAALPGVRAAIDARMEQLRKLEMPAAPVPAPAPAAEPAQAALFS